MKYTCNNKINQVYDRHYKLKYLSNMKQRLRVWMVGKGDTIFAKAKQMSTAVSNFWNARTDAGMTPSLRKFVI